MLQQRKCKTCKSLFMGGPRAYYCPVCRKIRQRERERRYKKYGPERKLGSIDQCERCGKDYVVEGGLQRFCPGCQPIHYKEYDRVTSLRFYHKYKQRINPVRNERRRIGLVDCIECGKFFDPEGTCRRYCSKVCKKKRLNRLWREVYYPKKAERRRLERNTQNTLED